MNSVPQPALPASPIQGLHTIELLPEREAGLQRFFEANPQYFIAVNGEPAGPNEAPEEIHAELPAGWPFTKKWLVGHADANGELVGMVNVITDLLAPRVWHIGLFMVATARHGTGDAQALYRSTEDWAASNGATWMRLGVVLGNARAERFWARQGYAQARTRTAVPMGRLVNSVSVMVKPLAGGTLCDYLSLVPRDRPDEACAAPQALRAD